MSRLWIVVASLFISASAFADAPATAPATRPAAAVAPPVPIGADSVVTVQPQTLFNGWKLSPAGVHAQISDVPLKLQVAPDGKFLIAVCSGQTTGVAVVDISSRQTKQFIPLPTCFNGLAFSKDGKTFYVTGGNSDRIYQFDYDAGKINLRKTVSLTGHPQTVGKKKAAVEGNNYFLAGIAVHPKSGLLYVCNEANSEIWVIDPKDESIQDRIDVGDYPHSCVIGIDPQFLYVSNWGERTVGVIDTNKNTQLFKIGVGVRPNEMALGPDGRLFVCCAGDNTVHVINTHSPKQTDEHVTEHAPPSNGASEVIATSLYPQSPEGSTPDGICVSPDGKALFVANADNNDVMVVDISDAKVSNVVGFVPSGWYPTAVASNGSQLFIASGKGLANFGPNTPPPNRIALRDVAGIKFSYQPSMLKGFVSFIDTPTGAELAKYTEQVRTNTPYVPEELHRVVSTVGSTAGSVGGSTGVSSTQPADTCIPTRVGDPCPIKHIVYIIKENRTYDQVLGDMKDASGKKLGNSDPSICMFGEDVSPNHHKIARDYVLFDNLYCNSEVSVDGHSWCDGAIATDFRQRSWIVGYTGHGDLPGNNELRTPAQGMLWDQCKRAGVTFRCYGEGNWSVPSNCRGKWGGGRDMNRVQEWIDELHGFEKAGDMPQFEIMSMGEDHTTGTKPKTFTPQACVASNDIAVGKLVAAATRSKFWPEMAIFIIEDDSQNGPDHVDAHRTVGLVVSPYINRGMVDSTPYTTTSMVRTMELILGLAPMTQYDAAATPMFACFGKLPQTVVPYDAQKPQTNVTAMNTVKSPGAQASAKMDFDDYDDAPEEELNQVLWLATRGADSPYPPPVHRAIFTR